MTPKKLRNVDLSICLNSKHPNSNLSLPILSLRWPSSNIKTISTDRIFTTLGNSCRCASIKKQLNLSSYLHSFLLLNCPRMDWKISFNYFKSSRWSEQQKKIFHAIFKRRFTFLTSKFTFLRVKCSWNWNKKNNMNVKVTPNIQPKRLFYIAEFMVQDDAPSAWLQ